MLIAVPTKVFLLVVSAVFLCASPGTAGSPSDRLAQLNIDIGGTTLGKKKCREEHEIECLEQHEGGRKNKDKRDKLKFLDPGIGITIDGTKAQKSGTGTVKKKKNKPGNASAPKKDKNKIAKQPESDPKDKPLFVPPEFPALAMRDCDDCYELWESILWYEWIISVDSRKLFDRRQDLEDRKDEIEDLRSRLPKANSIDRVYYNQEIARHEQYIEAVNKLNDEFAELIKKEWAILRERIDQYAECADRYCPKLVKELPDELLPPPTAAVTDEPPATPAPTEPPASENGHEMGASLKLDLGYGKAFGYDSYGSTYSSPPPPRPQSRPPEDQNLKICGPDVTEAVVKTLKKIRKEFNGNPDKQAAACRSLIDPRTGGYAWDIIGLNPSVAVPKAGEGEKPYTYEKEHDAWVQRDATGAIKGWKQPWFTGESPMCAIPRSDPVCAPTVEFFGICEHAQIVNYIQWRFMLGLCGGAYPYAGPLLHKAWNTVQYGGNAPQEQQANMSKVAKKILDKLDSNEDETDFSDIKDALVEFDSGVNKDIRQCELKCPIKIDREFDYIWVGLKSERPVETERLDRDLKDITDAGVKKLKTAAEEAGYSTSLRPSAVLGNILKALGLN